MNEQLPRRRMAEASTNILGRIVGTAIRNEGSRSAHIVRIVDKLASPRISDIEPLPAEESEYLRQLLRKTAFWHGSGRFQYNRKREVVDVLRNVAACGYILPSPDPFDTHTSGTPSTISLARAHSYARAYADIHGKGSAEPNRHGSAGFWARVFIADAAFEMRHELGGWRAVQRHFRETDKASWPAKVTSQPHGIFATFQHGSDIAENFPMVFGVAETAVTAVETSHWIAAHEVRAGNPIALSNGITHIQVPREHLSFVEDTLSTHRYPLPVVALEDIERYMATRTFSQLMRGDYGS